MSSCSPVRTRCFRVYAGSVPSLFLSGLLFAAAASPAVMAQTSPSARAVVDDPHAAFITEASQRFGIPEHWIRAVRRVESAGDVRALSSAGAMGLMQVMPRTWAGLRIRYDLGRDPYDPRDNILAGTAYLREMYDRYGSPGFLAAYNAGPGRYEEYLAGRPLPAETQAYVALLAPHVGAGDLTPMPFENAGVVTVDPDAWRRAPLFVSPSRGASDTPASHPDSQLYDASAAIALQTTPADPPPSDGIFIARMRDGDRP